jgi:hypothetical protein
MSAAQVRSYAAKAEEFAETATSLAVHAGINSADAVCGARLGQRASGDDHDQVLVLLRQAGPDGAANENRVRVGPARCGRNGRAHRQPQRMQVGSESTSSSRRWRFGVGLNPSYRWNLLLRSGRYT